VGHDQGPGGVVQTEIGSEDPEQGVPGKLKPCGQDRIVDMPKAVYITEPGAYRNCKHDDSTFNILIPFQKKNLSAKYPE
jgi:hypothetical protein